MKKPIIELPFMSEFGEVNVGDKVAVLSTGYSHSVNFGPGVYMGYIVTEAGKYVKVMRESLQTVQFFPNGKEFNWSKDYNHNTWNDIKDTLVSRQVVKHKMTTLYLNRIAPLKSQ